MNFLYFIPDVVSATTETVASLGLAYAITGTGGRRVHNGPGGRNGVILCGDSAAIGGYYPDRQKWAPAPQGDAESPPFWVGFDLDAKPTPESLARKGSVDGQWVTLRGGTRWLVPHLRTWHTGDGPSPLAYRVELPTLVSMDRYGNASQGSVVPEYQQIFDVGLRLHAQLAHGERTLTEMQWYQFAADLLSMNYRVTLLELCEEVGSYLAFDDVMRIVHAGIDWDGYLRALGNVDGRPERPTTDSDSGSAVPTLAESADTAQPLVS